MYVAIHPYFFQGKILLKYSRTELVEDASEIQHPILRVVLQRMGISGVDINSIADIPASTGLGSSGAFTVGLLQSLYAYVGKHVPKERLAEEACDVEMNQLHEPIGKQDQYASAFGGLNLISFHANETVDVEPVIIPHGKVKDLERNLMLFYLGGTRPASSVLSEQTENTLKDPRVFETLSRMAEMASALRLKLSNGDIDSLGGMLHEGWLLKQTLASKISNESVQACYQLATKNGAVGGKLLGAGGGGFLLIYVYPDAQERVRSALHAYREVKFAFDHSGATIVHVGDDP